MKERMRTFFSWNTLWSVTAACVLSVAGSLLIHGVPLMGLPKAEEVKAVTIVWNGEERTVTETDDVKLLADAAHLLHYRLFGGEQAGAETPILSVTYRLKAGGSIRLEAGSAVVRWKGKVHTLEETDIFIKIIQKVFYDSGEDASVSLAI